LEAITCEDVKTNTLSSFQAFQLSSRIFLMPNRCCR
jgi:hypothetical protein